MKFQCRWCKKEEEIPVTLEQLAEWQGGKFIQDVMPELSPGQRELLISETCETCFDSMFKEIS